MCVYTICNQTNIEYQIMEWLGLEGTFKAHLVYTTCDGHKHLTDEAAQSPIQPQIGHCQRKAILNLDHPQLLGNLF